MHFEFTVRLDDGDHDVLVRTPRPLRLGEVWPRLLALLDSPAHVRPHVEPGVVLGSRQLPTGAVIRCADERGHDGGDGRSAHDPAGNLAVHVVGGRDAGATAPLRPGSTRIGRDPHSAIVLHDERVSRQHVTMHLDSTGISLHDDTSTNGTTIEGVPLGPDGSPLATGAIARIGDTLLAVHRGDETPLPIVSFGNRQQVTPVPRRPHPPPTVLDVAGRSRRAGPRPTQWLAALIPALAAGALAWLLHSPTFLLFALLSPAMLLGTAFGDRLHLRRSRRSDDVTRRVRDASDEQAVATALRAETAARRARHPDPVVIGRAATVPTTTLWQRRRPDDDDVLTLRIGSAELTSSARVRRDGSTEPAGRLTAVPMTIDLRDGPVGVIGPPDVLDGLARCLVTQLAVLHPPSTVELALFLADQAGEARWRWARWLPHLGERVARSSGQCRDLAEQLSAPTGDRWTVAVIDRAVGAAQFAQPALFDQPAQSSDRGAPIRRTALVFGDSLTDLPPWCVGTLDLWADRGGGDTGEPVIDQTGEPVIDQVGEGWAEAVARALAPLSDAAGVGPTPERCALLDLLDVEGPTVAELLERWAASTGRADTALGTTADGRLELDLERDGPHVLVAGTTGSGKSELLRTLVLGLALQHPPDELSFVLVDYKGGAAFAECAGLPHVLGSVTDLDAHLTRRALHSLDAELRRRERLLAAAGASDLDGYRRTATQPLARLVIVVDEFAALADTLPDFLSGLVSVAQRGRSLGVHLVLATQRPGTAVTPEIRANTACRIALRVIEAAESSDIIGVPDAAALSSRRPGRALLSGDGAPVEFQTARVEGIDRARVSEVTVERLGPWRGRQSIGAVTSRSETSCAQIVEVVRRAAAERGVAPGVGPWSAPLPALLAAGSLPSSGAQLVPFGLVDRPSEQRQDILALDLDLPSSWLVVGGPRSGRTTTLLSVVLAAAAASSPADLEIYVIDGAGPLATVLNGLPHVATCLGPDELMAAGPLLRRLAARGTGTARVLLVIDQGERVLTGDEHATGTVCTSELNVLLGVHRVTVLTAGSLALLMPRVVSGFEHKAGAAPARPRRLRAGRHPRPGRPGSAAAGPRRAGGRRRPASARIPGRHSRCAGGRGDRARCRGSLACTPQQCRGANPCAPPRPRPGRPAASSHRAAARGGG